MTKLYKVGWGFSPDNIEDSVKDALEESRISVDKNDPGNYVTFENITFERKKDADSSVAIKDALINNKSQLTRIYGDVIKVKNGHRTRAAAKVLLGHLPQLIKGRNTFIVGGSDYNIVNQLRRNSSAYVSQDSNGDTFAEFNLAKGRNFDISLDPHTNMFYIEIGTSRVLLRPLLEALDVTADQFRRVVGEKLFQSNWTSVSTTQMETNYRKLYGKLYEWMKVDPNGPELDEIKREVKDYYKSRTRIDPVTTKYLYDFEGTRVDGELMLATLKKFIAVADGKEPGVDVDDLYYQRLFPPNLLFKDRIEKLMPEITQKMRYKLKNEGNYKKAFEGFISRPLVSMVNSSNLSRLDPQYNPLGIFSAGTTVTPLGMGGIQEIEAIRRAQRGVHNSYMGVIDPIASPQGYNSGIQSKLVDDVAVDKDGNIHIPVKKRNGQIEYKRLTELFDHKVLLPGQLTGTGSAWVLYRGKIVKTGSKSDAEFTFVKDTESLLNDLNKLVPFPQAVQGNRNYMNFRFLTQALPLQNREKPSVLPVTEEGQSTYSLFRHKLETLIPSRSPYSGTVRKLTGNQIIIRDAAGEDHTIDYHEHLPFATNTGLHQEPIVKVGDHVTKGQLILSDEYTDEKGDLAIGVNLKTAYTPYYGGNAEDAVVISEGASKKLTSTHYYTYTLPLDDTRIIDKRKFREMFPDRYKIDVIEKLDEDGVVKKGQKVTYGDIIIAAIDRRTPDDKLEKFKKISNKIVLDLVDGAVTFPVRVEGDVVEVLKTPKLISVTVRTNEPAEIGDKIANLYGGKGIIGQIMPDNQMLQDEEKKPIDAVWSSTVVVSRINPGQVYENALGKIVQTKRNGEQYRVPILKNPGGKSLHTFVQGELDKYKMKDKERVFDPVANKHIQRPVAVGRLYTLKLLKGDKDIAGRGVGPSYTSAEVPSKGGKEGAKALGAMEFYALVGHNARSLLTEASNIKGQKNLEFWRNFELGLSSPVRGNSFAWDKFKGMLTSAGGYVQQSNRMHEMVPVTDHLTDKLAEHRIVQTPALLKAKSLEPVKRGLFDPDVVGGLEGKLWSKIELDDGIISPLVSDYVKLALGMNAVEYKDWLYGSDSRKMRADLNKLDTTKILTELKVKSKQPQGLTNNDIKLYRFLTNMREKNINLADLVITKIPVPPPIYRPITKLENGETQLADLNLFYKDVMLANEGLRAVKGSKFTHEAKQTLVESVDALIGKREPINIQLQRKNSRGVLAYVGGVGSPKNGYIHSMMLKKTQDMSGRARIIPDPKMDPDSIGIPEKMAWKLFEPHTRAELIKAGRSSLEAQKLMDDHDPFARNIMLRVMDKTPVMANRAPTLHRFGMLAFHPKLIQGDSMAINMFATTPFNADFDGDAMQVHVPATPEGTRELSNYMLSKMPFNDADIDSLLYKLTTEAFLGFYQMSKEDPAQLKKDIHNILGQSYDVQIPLDKKGINKLLVRAVKEQPARVGDIFLKMKILGEKYATEIGSTVGIDDIAPMTIEKNKLLRSYVPKLANAKERIDKIRVMEQLQKDMITLATQHKGNLAEMVASGAKGKSNQLASIVTSPILAYDPDHPIDTAELTPGSFSEGLDIKDFWLQNAKARKDLVATALNVSVPGSLSKLMLANVNQEVISVHDCGTVKGIAVDYDSPDILGRILQETVPGLKRGSAITTETRSKLPRRKILVRSPLTCEAEHGICQLCYGTDSHWRLLNVGTNVGVMAAHSMAEPMAQMALDSKHGGRSITRDIGKGGMAQLQSIFSSDDSSPTVAVLSDEPDTVDHIEESPGGLRYIIMRDGTSYRIPISVEVLVKPGDNVKKGQALTNGVIPFTRMTELKGVTAGRQALSNEIQRVMGESGMRFHARLPELLGKAAVNQIEFMSPFRSFIPGDVITYNKFKGLAGEISSTISAKNLVPGMTLADEYDEFSAGHAVTDGDVRILRTKYDKIKVLPEDVHVRPTIKSLYTSGLQGEDWINSLGQKYIKRNLIAATAEGDMSNDASYSPMVPWLKGAPFNKKGPTY